MGRHVNPSITRRRKATALEPLANLAVQQATLRAISDARDARGMTRRDLELASGVSPAMFADLCAMRRLATVRQVVQMADAVGLRAVLIPDPEISPDSRAPGLP